MGSEGVIVTVAPEGEEAGLLGLRGAGSEDQGAPDQALAASRSRRRALLHRVPAASPVQPVVRRPLQRVPRARAGSPYTRDFEDMTAFLAQQMNQTAVARVMRIARGRSARSSSGWWPTSSITSAWTGLVFIGVDEVSHGADRQFLTYVADHVKPRIVWAAPGRNAATLQGFFDSLTDEQKASIRAVSIDMSAGYEKAIRAKQGLPHAQVCFDPLPRRPPRLRSDRQAPARSTTATAAPISRWANRHARPPDFGSL